MNNYTLRSQYVLALARKEAERFNHHWIGAEHLLLGLIKLGQGLAVSVLRKIGLEIETVRAEVAKQVGAGRAKPHGNIAYTPRVKKILALAAAEAKSLNHSSIGTEHILLGLLGEGEGVAAAVFRNLKVDIEKTRNEIRKHLQRRTSWQKLSPQECDALRAEPIRERLKVFPNPNTSKVVIPKPPTEETHHE